MFFGVNHSDVFLLVFMDPVPEFCQSADGHLCQNLKHHHRLQLKQLKIPFHFLRLEVVFIDLSESVSVERFSSSSSKVSSLSNPRRSWISSGIFPISGQSSPNLWQRLLPSLCSFQYRNGSSNLDL